MSLKCTLCGSENLLTICQFHDEYITLCSDCDVENSHDLIVKLYRKVKELEARLEPCEVCNSIDCEDASKEYYIKRWKEAEKRVQELENELHQIYLDQAGEAQ